MRFITHSGRSLTGTSSEKPYALDSARNCICVILLVSIYQPLARTAP